jgi:metallo-beta-lactamase family protein
MRLSFFGATEEVTGSCFLVESGTSKILIDCGMKQGERMCILRSLEDFGFTPSSLNAVLVTHAHFDHTGRLPELVHKGYKGPIYMTAPTKSLTAIILDDSLGIMTENAKRCGDPVPYEKEDELTAIAQMQGVNYHTEFEPAPGIKVMFHDAGHILGSSFITLDFEHELTESGKPLRIAFSGDLGNDDVPILSETDALHRADIVVCESTYGDRDHEPTSQRTVELEAFAKKVLERHGTLIIPAFSIERTQELLYELDKLVEEKKLPQVPIYLDSPLAIKATEIYRHFDQYLKFDHPAFKDNDFFSFPTLKETVSADESKLINEDHRPKIIIAGNGMMTGGRVLHHLKRYLDDKNSGVLVVGFQAPGTLGRKILSGTPSVRIYGEEVKVFAEVASIESFSAHGDRAKIARWLHTEEGSVKKIFLVHGEGRTKESFAQYLKKSLSAEIILPRIGQVFEL